jgi:hypothetical protein
LTHLTSGYINNKTKLLSRLPFADGWFSSNKSLHRHCIQAKAADMFSMDFSLNATQARLRSLSSIITSGVTKQSLSQQAVAGLRGAFCDCYKIVTRINF